eukprot:CAMPEP_0206579994 /NCGR_PEP_ID=MMETSP0325_2-20121206/32884_1 /ASSEMBLY_ACC=CAM_ASM_000347 /TAXON_ID=2866 /ORGANISM="Crypthecodinium cohnii, Strain Seligo" /LENGTH=132 /DNA_ID=CAMNT_0054085919 /DNA_START=87 /DNA_END=482 /DNA_ORIENTATION=+
MARSSIWDIRDLRGHPNSPRKVLTPSSLTSPRMGRIGPPTNVLMANRPEGAAARLSTIGRIAMRERSLQGFGNSAEAGSKRLWSGRLEASSMPPPQAYRKGYDLSQPSPAAHIYSSANARQPQQQQQQQQQQ